jgi:hypothetical protein
MAPIDKISHWASTVLIGKGYQLQSAPEIVQQTPWSSVRRLPTADGDIYLKQTPPLLSLEPELIQILRTQFNAPVPDIIAVNTDLHCFLMKDAGKPYYDFKNGATRLQWITNAIQDYHYIQDSCVPHTSDLITLGVPDWRLTQLPALYEQLIQQEALLIEDGIRLSALRQLPRLTATCVSLCEQLSSFNLPETLDHCDLHGGNVLIDAASSRTTLIDWGETVITHPFFSRTALLQNLVDYYGFEEQELQSLCFETKALTGKALQTAIQLAKKLEPVYAALAFYRLFQAADKLQFMARANCKGRISRYLEAFISKNAA